MDMLVPYTPVAALSEDEKKRLIAQGRQLGKQQGFVQVGDKIVSVNELNGQPKPAVRQNLFE